WRFDLSGHQKCRPVNSMEPQDVLAYQLQIGRPKFLEMRFPAKLPGEAAKSYCRNVVRQRLGPDVDRMPGVVRNRDGPFNRDAAYREIVESVANKADHLIAPGFRPDEIRVGFIKREQSLLKGRKFEKIALFGNAVKLTFVHRADGDAIFARFVFVFAVKLVAVGTIPAFILAFIDVTVCLRTPP